MARVALRDAARRPHRLARPVACAPEGGAAPGAWRCPTCSRSATPRVEDYLEPMVHEIKVRRADLLSDLRHAGQARGLPRLAQPVLVRAARGHRRAAGDPEVYGVHGGARRRRRSTSPGRRPGAPMPRCRSRSGWRSRAPRPMPVDDSPQRWLGEPDGADALPKRLGASARCTTGGPAEPIRGCRLVAPVVAAACAWRSRREAARPRRPAVARRAGSLPPSTTSPGWPPRPTPTSSAPSRRRAAENKPLLLYWGANWCPPCNQLKATLFNRQDFAERSQVLRRGVRRRRPARRAEARRALQGPRLPDDGPVQRPTAARSRACRARSTRRR